MKKAKKIYIAGPISNTVNYMKDFNNAEAKLVDEGYIVLNPSILPDGLTQEEYMRICIPMLQVCDAIYMLKGWQNSIGACIEYELANQAKKHVLYE